MKGHNGSLFPTPDPSLLVNILLSKMSKNTNTHPHTFCLLCDVTEVNCQQQVVDHNARVGQLVN